MVTTTDGKRQLCCVLTYESVFPHYAFGQLHWCMSPFTAINPSPTVSISCLMNNGHNYLPLWCFFLYWFGLGVIFRSGNKEEDHRGEDQLQKEDEGAAATKECPNPPHSDRRTPLGRWAILIRISWGLINHLLHLHVSTLAKLKLGTCGPNKSLFICVRNKILLEGEVAPRKKNIK